MLAIKIPVCNLEETRQIIVKNKILSLDHKIKVENNYGLIPIINIDKKELDEIIKEIKENIISNKEEFTINIIESELEEQKHYPKSISELLKGKLTKEESENLKTSFDIIGDIVILEIPEELQKHKKEIGEAALKITKRKTVFMKKSAIKGVTRTRELELIAGEDNSITTHKEHGARLKLDVKNVYFSPRLATERKRVADATKDGEEILDMFAGIGPFPVIIARNKSVKITAVDINDVAIKYLKENAKRNKLKEGSEIISICGDTNIVAENEIKGKKFDRLIMNLPGLAPEFLDLAISLTKDGGVIHYYEFSNGFSHGISKVQELAKKHNRTVEILNTRKVKNVSPREWHVAIDCKINEIKN